MSDDVWLSIHTHTHTPASAAKMVVPPGLPFASLWRNKSPKQRDFFGAPGSLERDDHGGVVQREVLISPCMPPVCPLYAPCPYSLLCG